jgi:hypothetical protein
VTQLKFKIMKFLKYVFLGLICLSVFSCSDPLRGGDEDDDPIPIPPPPKPKPLVGDTVNIGG